MRGLRKTRQAAAWHVWCPYNLPFIDTMQWYLPAVAFCWMPGFRGLKFFILCFEWSIGFHYCDDMSHTPFNEPVSLGETKYKYNPRTGTYEGSE